MSRNVSVNRWMVWSSLLISISMMLNTGYAATRHTLLITNEDSNIHVHILELLSNGAIITTGQILNVGAYADHQIAVSPDSRFMWCGTYSDSTVGFRQYAITSFGQVTATERFIPEPGGYTIKFTPNGELLLLDGPIYRAYPDGSVESTGHNYIAEYNLSPSSDINLSFDGFGASVDKIDYSGASVYNIQYVALDGGGGAQGWEAVYTPDNKYTAIVYSGGVANDVEVYPILENGSLDTTHVQGFDMFLGRHAGYIAISKDGNYIYVGEGAPNQIGILRKKSTGDGYEDTGWRTALSFTPWQMMVSPDGKYLVITDSRSFQTYAIQDDGNLVFSYSFPFETIFGTDPQYFQFAYPEAATEINSCEWQRYQ